MHCHCGTNNRAPRWTFTDPCKPEVRPGAREESASPVWLAAPAMNAQYLVCKFEEMGLDMFLIKTLGKLLCSAAKGGCGGGDDGGGATPVLSKYFRVLKDIGLTEFKILSDRTKLCRTKLFIKPIVKLCSVLFSIT